MILTCNPLKGSWLLGFVEWYLDQVTGIPLPERANVVRYYSIVKGLVFNDFPEYGDFLHMTLFLEPIEITAHYRIATPMFLGGENHQVDLSSFATLPSKERCAFGGAP